MPLGKASLVLAIDIGTSSVRTALFDARARRVPGSLMQREHSVSYSAHGAAELTVDTLGQGLQACLQNTLRHVNGRKISDVGVSCFWHSLVGTDEKGRVCTPIYTWADARCREDAARLRADMSEVEYHAHTGCMLRASYWPAKLRWLARTQPRLWQKVALWQSPAEWFLGQFCERGAERCSHGMATGSGLYDPRNKRWDPALIKHCGLELARLPVITEEPLRLRDNLCASLPPLADARWWPAIGDGAAGNLGSGATRPGRAAVNVGTSAALRVMREGKIGKIPAGLFCYRVDARRFVVGGAVSNAGNLRAWCRRELNLSTDEETLDRALTERPEPLRSLVVLPFWSAERAPTWCEGIGGTVTGLSQETTALDLLQATTEAVYQRLAFIADLSLPSKAAQPSPELVVSGGILKSPGLLQRLADVLGRPVCPSTEPEASLRGAAVYALECSGETIGEAGIVGRVVQPRKRIVALYAKERRRQQRLERLIAGAGRL